MVSAKQKQTNGGTDGQTDVYAAFRVYYFAGGWSGEVQSRLGGRQHLSCLSCARTVERGQRSERTWRIESSCVREVVDFSSSPPRSILFSILSFPQFLLLLPSFARLPLLLLSSPFWLRSSLTSSGSIFLGMLVLFFFFLFFTRMSPLIFLPYCRLLFPMRPLSSLPFFISFAYDIAASFCPPPVVRTFSAFKSMSFYQCSSRREGEKDFGLSCVFFFFYKLNVIIFDFFFFLLAVFEW